MIGRRSKFGNVRSASKLAGRMFDSKAEREYCEYLTLRERAGDGVSSLRFQVTFKLVVNGLHVASYRADAVYNDDDGRLHVVDVKGAVTMLYRLKKKLMSACLGIVVEEVRRNPRGGWTVS